MSDHEIVWIYEDDFAVIMTLDQKLFGIWGHSQEEIQQDADMLQEWMSDIMKLEEHKHGCWLWRIKNDRETIYGEYLGEEEDE